MSRILRRLWCLDRNWGNLLLLSGVQSSAVAAVIGSSRGFTVRSSAPSCPHVKASLGKTLDPKLLLTVRPAPQVDFFLLLSSRPPLLLFWGILLLICWLFQHRVGSECLSQVLTETCLQCLTVISVTCGGRHWLMMYVLVCAQSGCVCASVFNEPTPASSPGYDDYRCREQAPHRHGDNQLFTLQLLWMRGSWGIMQCHLTHTHTHTHTHCWTHFKHTFTCALHDRGCYFNHRFEFNLLNEMC